jgi:ElaB/YqjD/DUF883 family membrane-anchored ribosome-binding protein
MGVFRSLLVLTVGAAIGGAVLLAYRVSQESGKSLMESWADVPGEAQRLFSDVRGRAEEALERGREAYQSKQTEIVEHLQGAAQAE